MYEFKVELVLNKDMVWTEAKEIIKEYFDSVNYRGYARPYYTAALTSESSWVAFHTLSSMLSDGKVVSRAIITKMEIT